MLLDTEYPSAGDVLYGGCNHSIAVSLEIHSTPATTSVAACMTADTDVGPSIASGSQE